MDVILNAAHGQTRSGVALSVVVPCFNEEEALPELIQKLVPHLESATDGSWELILVDDGSADATARMFREIHEKEPRVRGLLLSRNFGHQPALFAGLAYASGRHIGIMDADLQDPPEVLIQCYRKAVDENYDLVYGRRQNREGSIFLRLSYWAFYRVMRSMADYSFPLDAGDFSVFNRKVLTLMMQLPEHVRVLRGLRSWVGLKQGFVAYNRPQRGKGTSKYSVFKLLSLALNSMVSFSSVPLRMASFLGLFMSGLTLLTGALLLVNRFFPKFTLFNYYIGANPGTTTVVTLLLVISSLLFLCLGILGEYLSILIKEVKKRPVAIVRQHFGIARKPLATNLVVEVSCDEED